MNMQPLKVDHNNALSKNTKKFIMLRFFWGSLKLIFFDIATYFCNYPFFITNLVQLIKFCL